MREYLTSPECHALHFRNLSDVRTFIKAQGLHLKRTAQISVFGTIIGQFMIDPSPARGGYYVHHHHALPLFLD
jgi:hypothetical protein